MQFAKVNGKIEYKIKPSGHTGQFEQRNFRRQTRIVEAKVTKGSFRPA